MKLLYDQSVFSDKFLLEWHDATLRLDKKSILYNRKAEKALRPLMNDFIEWLKSDDYGEEYGEEGAEEEEATIKEEKPVVEESDAAKAQRELIEA